MMEHSLCVKNTVFAAPRSLPERHSPRPVYVRRKRTQFRKFRFVVHSKKSTLQEFQDYAKPLHLLPATEVKVYDDSLPENLVTSLKERRTESIYEVQIQTSREFGSGLTDPNAGVLLCLIDESGNSILQRIPSSLVSEHPLHSHDKVNAQNLHFLRGSVDEFKFEGPKLGKIVAVWISVESGQWRLGGMTLSIISEQQPPASENDNKHLQSFNCQYAFLFDDILLGEGSDVSMMELRPSSVTEFAENNITSVKENFSTPSLLGSNSISNEESMREYADLKFSLLLYDAILTVAGSSILSLSAGENAAFAFLTGGIVGFLYLVFVQRSVDGLPIPELVSRNTKGDFGSGFGTLKGPVMSLVLVLSFAVVVSKYAPGDAVRVLKPEELMLGMLGFLMCKLSVLLAAFKPIPAGFRENQR